jgi:hypothetical protein
VPATTAGRAGRALATTALVLVGGSACAVAFVHLTALNVSGISRQTTSAVSSLAAPVGIVAAAVVAAIAFGVHGQAVRRGSPRPRRRGALAAAGAAGVATVLGSVLQVVGWWILPAIVGFGALAAGSALLVLPPSAADRHAPPVPAPRGWSSPWWRAGFWLAAALGVPALTVAWTSIEFAMEEDAESAYAGASGGPALLLVALVGIALAHLAGWALLRGIAHAAPASSRRRGALTLGVVMLASSIGLVAALVLTDGQLFLPYPRPYVP